MRANESAPDIESFSFDEWSWISWDEHVPSSLQSTCPEQWSRLQLERESDLLLLFIYHGVREKRSIRCLLLKPHHGSEDDIKFVRVGCVKLGNNPVTALLIKRLERRPDEELPAVIDLDDPRLADLVHVVSII